MTLTCIFYVLIVLVDHNLKKVILKLCFFTDTRVVRWKVREFFSGGKIITNESDCK